MRSEEKQEQTKDKTIRPGTKKEHEVPHTAH